MAGARNSAGDGAVYFQGPNHPAGCESREGRSIAHSHPTSRRLLGFELVCRGLHGRPPRQSGKDRAGDGEGSAGKRCAARVSGN